MPAPLTLRPLRRCLPPRGRAAVFLLLLSALPAGLRAQGNPPPPPVPTTAATPTSSQSFQAPKVLKRLPPRYPLLARLNRAEGVVRARFSVDDAGHVTAVVASKSSGSVMLDSVVLEPDLRQWTFQPAMLDGKPVPGTYEQEFEFHLDPAQERAEALKRMAAPVGTPDAPYPKEALALTPRPQGTCTIGVTWTSGGLVDSIYLSKSTGSNLLDQTALLFAYENWRVDPKTVTDKDKEFVKTMTLTPPPGPNDTPPPLTR